MAKIRQIALAFPVAEQHHREMLEGITEFAQGHKRWALYSDPEYGSMSVTDLKGWPGNGVIAFVSSTREVAAALALNIPVVGISSGKPHAGIPRVLNDNRTLGYEAAEHLMQRGLWRFAYYGLKNVRYSAERDQGFIERLAKEGYQSTSLEASSRVKREKMWYEWRKELRRWLKGLEYPLGIMAVHDNRARMVIDACQEIGLQIPHEVAVIGVGNDPTSCNFPHPTLSTIPRHGKLIGYEAAALLDRLMSGKQSPRQDIIIAPDRVVERESTDLVAINDPDLSEVVRFIREHYTENINLDGVVEHVMVSRRWLEHRFKRYFNCTPHEFLCRLRVERTKQLLTGPRKMSLVEIARECGFSGPRNLRLVFKRITGSMPREYRISHQTTSKDDRKKDSHTSS